MKFFFIVTLVCLLGLRGIQAAESEEKRFIGGWINTIVTGVTDTFNTVVNVITDNVINPVVDGWNTVVDTVTGININEAINTVVDTVWKPIESGVVDAYNQVVSGVSTAVDATGSFITNLVGASTGPTYEVSNPDFCSLRCQSKNSEGATFFYDEPNGCAAKGFVNVGFSQFHRCCDAHNVCLNSKCCTTDCQQHKDACDLDYKRCLRSVCNGIFDFDEQDKCVTQANFISSHASAYKCNPNEVRNRKLCIC